MHLFTAACCGLQILFYASLRECAIIIPETPRAPTFSPRAAAAVPGPSGGAPSRKYAHVCSIKKESECTTLHKVHLCSALFVSHSMFHNVPPFFLRAKYSIWLWKSQTIEFMRTMHMPIDNIRVPAILWADFLTKEHIQFYEKMVIRIKKKGFSLCSMGLKNIIGQIPMRLTFYKKNLDTSEEK